MDAEVSCKILIDRKEISPDNNLRIESPDERFDRYGSDTYKEVIKGMIKILFVCHGNICRSPMAEFILKKRVKDNGLTEEFYIDSAATSMEEIGNPIYPPAEKMLKSHAIPYTGRRARQMSSADYQQFDMIIAMDQANVRNIRRLVGEDREQKIHLLSEYASFSGDIEDPWYTGNFEKVYRQINDGCEGLLWSIRRLMRDL